MTYVTVYSFIDVTGYIEPDNTEDRALQLYAPESGGLISPGIRYVGFADRSQTESREIRYGETGRVALCDGDLVTITCVDGGVSILLAAFDESGSDALQQLNLETT